MPWPRASSPRSNVSCWTATPGLTGRPFARRCSTSSKSSTTANAATRPWTTPAPRATSSTTNQQHPPHSQAVYENGPTPGLPDAPMSSHACGQLGGSELGAGRAGLLVGAQGAEHDVREPASQQPDGLGAGLAPGDELAGVVSA